MTADDPRPAGERELLAAALWADDVGSDAPAFNATSPANQRCYLRTADALLPVVDRIASERAAAELDELADCIPCSDSELEAKTILRARAAALRAATGEAT